MAKLVDDDAQKTTVDLTVNTVVVDQIRFGLSVDNRQ